MTNWSKKLNKETLYRIFFYCKSSPRLKVRRPIQHICDCLFFAGFWWRKTEKEMRQELQEKTAPPCPHVFLSGRSLCLWEEEDDVEEAEEEEEEGGW